MVENKMIKNKSSKYGPNKIGVEFLVYEKDILENIKKQRRHNCQNI